MDYSTVILPVIVGWSANILGLAALAALALLAVAVRAARRQRRGC